jgi:WD40 repeat protein
MGMQLEQDQMIIPAISWISVLANPWDPMAVIRSFLVLRVVCASSPPSSSLHDLIIFVFSLVTFSHSGRFLFSASEDSMIRVWDILQDRTGTRALLCPFRLSL